VRTKAFFLATVFTGGPPFNGKFIVAIDDAPQQLRIAAHFLLAHENAPQDASLQAYDYDKRVL